VAISLLLASVYMSQVQVREVLITRDTVLSKNSLLNARLVIRASNVTIEGNGCTLVGPGKAGTPESFVGNAIESDGFSNVTIRGVKAKGWASGLRASNGRGWLVEGCDFSDNFHNPKFGWGEQPPRGGFILSAVHDSVLRSNKANNVWDALSLDGCEGNLVQSNDFSHCSNVCAKLWRSSRNRFLENNLSYGIRKDPGEVHARDSTSVLLESGSDDNYFFRNDITHGGDGIFIRVLNGWISAGNTFVENDTSYANNNCVESWSPGNTFIRNKANHGSYGFWMGGSDRSVLIGNEAAFNGLPDGNHNAPEPGFGHGGIVFVSGSSHHTVLEGNYCHDNNGGGIVLRGDVGTKGGAFQAYHWIIQNNRLDRNRWGIWAQYADWVYLGPNASNANKEADHFENVTHVVHGREAPGATAPVVLFDGPALAEVGREVVFDASRSRDPMGGKLNYRVVAGPVESEGPILRHSFSRPGFYRVGVTADNGTLASLEFKDLIVVNRVAEELGTEGNASSWGAEFSEDGGRVGRAVFADEPGGLFGRTCLRFTQDPYPGAYATAIYPMARNADWDVSGKKWIRFWIRVQNPNVPSWQNTGPVVTLESSGGRAVYGPANGGNALLDLKNSEDRWGWVFMEIPLAGGAGWKVDRTASFDPSHVRAVSIGLDSWGGTPFMVWLDGLVIE
jgi:parallel beta-helix repeat protein